MYGGSTVRHKDFVRCLESRSVCYSEVANVLQLWCFQSITQQVSVGAWLLGGSVMGGSTVFHCSSVFGIETPVGHVMCVKGLIGAAFESFELLHLSRRNGRVGAIPT